MTTPASVEATGLRLLLGLGVAANLAFLAINFSPERPHLRARRHYRLALRSSESTAAWLRQNVLGEFAKANDIELDVVSAASNRAMVDLLAKEAAAPTDLLAADISGEFADDLVRARSVRPLDGVLPAPELQAGLDQFIPQAGALTHDEKGSTWFWPRRAELTVAAFLDDAVEAAYLGWEGDRRALDAALKEANGVGLPADFRLERSPDAWDSYDLFVAAWYWAHHEAPWADPLHPHSPATAARPRVAWRTGHDDDATYDLLGKLYRHGMTDAELGQKTSPAVIDALQWEALFRRHHLLVPECERPEGLSEAALNELFKSGALAWAPLDQEDSLWLHGGARRDAPPGLPSPARLDWSLMPAAQSLELHDGAPARVGRTFAFQEIQLWALPVASPDPALALALMRFATGRALMQRETEAQGILPVRKDLRDNYAVLFRLEWMQRVLDACFAQMAQGSGPMPDRVAEQHLDQTYATLAERLLATQPLPLTHEAVKARLEELAR